MAQHDYVIANGTGAAVRSDLNNALAAIVSQNSGPVAPTTTYAYMPWADTGSSPPVFKIRNAANNGWITLYELDGTFSIEAGSASSPGLYFTGDTNTGIYSPGADQFGIATGGTSRLVIDASGNINMDSGTVYVDAANNRLGIGTTPTQQLHVRTDQAAYTWARIDNQSSSASAYSGLQLGAFGNSWGLAIGSSAANSNSLTFVTDAGGSNSEKARFTSDGKFLVGTSTSTSVGGAAALSQIETGANIGLSVLRRSDTPIIAFGRTGGSGSTIVSDGDELGTIRFAGADGSTINSYGASISCAVDGTPGANVMPGRLVFSTTIAGASSPTERMRISNQGDIAMFSNNYPLVVATGQGAGTTYQLLTGRRSASSTVTGTDVFYVHSNGNVQNTNGSYTTISDAKLKENIVDARSQWADLKDIKIRNWNFKEETGHETHRQIGPIAQELEQVCPGLVFETPDRNEAGTDLGTVTKSVNQSVLYMKAVKALQEAMERIETLEAKVAALESA